jgi:hypothetical protein
MKPTFLLFLFFLSIAAAGQVTTDQKTNTGETPVLYVYDGLIIKSPDFVKTLDSTNFQNVEVITNNPELYHSMPENVAYVIITTKEKVNKKLKAFTGSVSQITKDYPYLEFCWKGKILESDSLRFATLSQMKPKSYKISFYPPFRAIKKFGEQGKRAVIEILPK